MTYEEKLLAYKEGALDEQTRAEVEAELEKAEAIDAYLAGDLFGVPGQDDALFPAAPSRAEALGARELKRSIDRAFVKAGLVLGVAVLASVLLIVFAVPKLVDRFYYDPGEKVKNTRTLDGEEANRLSLDLAVYTELMQPFRYRDGATVFDEGWGNYRIMIDSQPTDALSHLSCGFVNPLFAGEVRKNRLYLHDPSFFSGRDREVFARYLTNVDVRGGKTAEEIKEGLPKVTEGSLQDRAAVYVLLNRFLSYAEFRALYDDLTVETVGLLDGVSCRLTFSGPYALWEGEDAPNGGTVDFRPFNGGTIEYDGSDYPDLRTSVLRDGRVYHKTEELSTIEEEETLQTRHVVSMLRYMEDRNDEIEALLGDAFYPAAGMVSQDWGAMANALESGREPLRISAFSFETNLASLSLLIDRLNGAGCPVAEVDVTRR